MLLKKYKINSNLNYYFYNTKKYKSFSLKIYFLLPYDKDKITVRNLLKELLLFDSKNYDNPKSIERKRELYNLKLSISSTPLTNIHQFCLTVNGTNPKFFKDEEYTITKIFEYLKEVLFNPNIEGNKFNDSSFEKCFNRYKVALKTALEDKNCMALCESIDLMEDDINKFCNLGYLKDFDKITSEEVYQEYINLMNSEIIIAIAGDLDKKELKENLSIFSNFREYKDYIEMIPSKYQEYKKKEIEIKTEQAIVVMNFVTQIRKFDRNYFDILIFNMLFGGESNSKLFNVIREQYGICYEVYSNYEPNSGVITVYMGLANENIEIAQKLVLEQIKNIKKGNFTKTLIEQYKRNEYTRVQNVYDNIQSTLNREISLLIYNRNSSLKLLKEDLNKVTKEKVIKVASKLKLANTLIIKSKGESSYENN